MSIWTIGAAVLASLYIGAVMGALIKFTTYHVPHGRRWVAFLLPIGIPFQPLILFVLIRHAPKELKTDWSSRSIPQKFLFVASIYVAYFADLPIVLGIAAHALAHLPPTPKGIFARENDKPPHSYLRVFARESFLELGRFYRHTVRAH